MAVTDKELDAKRDRVEKLRQQIADTHSKRHERQVSAAREVEAAQLDAEAARLEVELAAAKNAASASAVKAGTSGVVGDAKEAMQQAADQEKAQAAAAAAAKEK